jgi:hypothetical protein
MIETRSSETVSRFEPIEALAGQALGATPGGFNPVLGKEVAASLSLGLA